LIITNGQLHSSSSRLRLLTLLFAPPKRDPQEIQKLLMSKYGKLYDLSFVKRSLPGKTFV
jgi:hypothetical protein